MIFAVVINNLPSEVNTVHGGEPPPRTRATPANFNLHGEATRPECPINAKDCDQQPSPVRDGVHAITITTCRIFQ